MSNFTVSFVAGEPVTFWVKGQAKSRQAFHFWGLWYILQASLNSLFHIILFLQVALQPLRHHQRMRQAHWALRHQSLCPLHALCSPCPLHTLCSPSPLWALLLRALESRGCQRNRRQGPGLQGFDPALVHLTQGPEHTICMSGVVLVGQPRNAPTLCFVRVCSFFANPQNPPKYLPLEPS